ncbi:MAG TPA: cyclic nucleotide-binding domain-containing protein [Labilithrix sp.]|nr:cyclic nucleotide-binding domain-containing protein [Labilithrix sp.]
MSTPKSPPQRGPDLASLPSTMPERKRMDGTMIAPLPSHGANPTFGSIAPDSYQPHGDGATAGMSHQPPTLRELIVPTTSPTQVILQEIRKSPQERLVIESRAASGGMGTIDVAVDLALDRRIAVKTLHAHLRSSDAAVRMFLREARLTGLLDHPHIVPVYDIGERETDHLYFSMKLVEGQTLGDVIRAIPRGPLDTTTLYGLLDVLTKVCDALAFAHSRGVLHCDIKPANIMVGEFGQVYLMDWGIARLVASEPSPASAPDPRAAQAAHPSATDNSIIGTPCYMSPEQARGDRGKLDARSDVFLLGSVLYEILTRRPPYSSSDRTETLSLAANGSFPAPRKIAKDGGVPPELERIVLRAMAKSPEARYPSVVALREDLLRFMRGGGDFPRRTFQAGETIVREGDQGEAAYIIVAGSCEIQKELPGGTETLQTIGPGAVFGEMAILTEGPRTATVVAVEPTIVMVVTSAILEQEMEALKPWMATLLKSLAARFRDVDTKHRATYAASPSPARMANQIMMIVATWGESDGPARWMKWSDLGAELEAQLGVPPLAIFAVTARYGMQLDLDANRLTIPNLDALRATLATELGR